MDVKAQALEDLCLFRLEHGSPRHSDARQAHVPQGLCVALALYKDNVAIALLLKFRDTPFPIKAYLSAFPPAEALIAVALTDGGLLAVHGIIGDFQIFNIVIAVKLGGCVATVPEPFLGQVLVKAVLFQGVGSQGGLCLFPFGGGLWLFG